eukprot:622883_1
MTRGNNHGGKRENAVGSTPTSKWRALSHGRRKSRFKKKKQTTNPPFRTFVVPIVISTNTHGCYYTPNEEFYGGISKNYDISSEYVYHYTSKSKAKQIIKSKTLFPSTNTSNDCLFGVGAYFTSLTPKNSKRDILYNNYGDETEYNSNKIVKLMGVRQINCGRNVWIYPTNYPLDLSAVSAEVACVTCDFGSISFACTHCDGNGIFNTYDCAQCDGSGTYQHYKQCITCYGNGICEFICTECTQGTVEVQCDCDGGYGFWGEFCYECDGEGQIYHQCDNCNGGIVDDDCQSCNATGNFYWNHTEQCNRCNGGTVVVQCNVCNGGELPCHQCDGQNVIYL